jgi:hypothetical protein
MLPTRDAGLHANAGTDEGKRDMNKLAIAFAFAVCLINSPALSRVAPHSGTTTCEGKVEVAPYSNPGWYQIDICSFEGNTPAGKAILDACGVGNPCQVKAYGEWAPDFYIKRIISVRQIDKAALNEMPEEYRGTWILYHGQGEPNSPNSAKEEQMPVGSKGIGWLNGLCNVTAVESTETLTNIIKETCAGRGAVTELWTLRNLNGAEMLIVATINVSSAAFKPDIAVYVRNTKPGPR